MTNKIPTLDFSDIENVEVPFEVNGAKYVLREATGGAVKKYNNARMACITYGSDGKVTAVRNLGDTESLLVSLCTFTSEGKPVSQDTVESWPGRIQKRLFQAAREISGLNKDATESELALFLQAVADPDTNAPFTTETLSKWAKALPDNYAHLKSVLATPDPKEH